jgi:hypothetical protein
MQSAYFLFLNLLVEYMHRAPIKIIIFDFRLTSQLAVVVLAILFYFNWSIVRKTFRPIRVCNFRQQ